MQQDRSARPRASRKLPFEGRSEDSSGFRPADALERLHTELVQLEVFAHLAAEVVTRLSPPSNRAQRRDYTRLYALVTKVADDAIAAVGRGDKLIAQLAASLKAADSLAR